ncbi:hypothetical protein ASPACDRAFT_82273 [Aspergillus aculeatus ATCC 16872]|uniref:Zn(2)-C6 fungal-type domain-containing protein n=1 Tax=Aspergillus aculeatus (strain ATCC 16872 / CBS 172.66 / WB 5094) TaxID=690307 RepID=A0A1L9WG61_ASPA1|nr:uncharacterized protein ASPACDRAFT_82273 [Aspergillus aculeatus ATCC 16872]OJJ95164.1 hypothetical protein ASPACDRAFT_82273 [Aspergillus aculeatus ATCC 16872]
MDEGSDSKAPRRKRVSRACDRCRSKKDKCDGLRPACSACQASGQTCSYDPHAKKRGLPEGYVRGLEKLWALSICNIEGFEDTMLALLGTTAESAYRRNKLMSLWTDDSTSESLHESWKTSRLYSALEKMLSNSDPSPHPSGKRTREDHEDDSTGGGAEWGFRIDRSSTVQSLDNPRVVGPSNFSQPKRPRLSLPPESQPPSQTKNGKQALQLPPQTSQLLDIYFAVTHSWFPIVAKHNILRASYLYAGAPVSVAKMAPGSGDHAALWALLSYTISQSRINPQDGPSGVLAQTKEYYSVARSLIPTETERYELGHVQALLLLTLVNVGLEDWTAAWLLGGQAVRMAISMDLGVFADVRRSDELRQGKAVFLGCFVVDSLLSFRMSRRPSMHPRDLNTVGLLEEDGLEEWNSWADVLPPTTVGQGKSPRRGPLLALSCFNRLVELASVLNKIARDFSPGSGAPLFSQQLVLELKQWDDRLPLGCRLIGPESIYPERHSSLLPHQSYLALTYVATLLWLYLRIAPQELGLPRSQRPAVEGAKKLLYRALPIITQHLENFHLCGLPPLFELSLRTIAEQAFVLRNKIESDMFPFAQWAEALVERTTILGTTWPVYRSLCTTIDHWNRSKELPGTPMASFRGVEAEGAPRLAHGVTSNPFTPAPIPTSSVGYQALPGEASLSAQTRRNVSDLRDPVYTTSITGISIPVDGQYMTPKDTVMENADLSMIDASFQAPPGRAAVHMDKSSPANGLTAALARAPHSHPTTPDSSVSASLMPGISGAPSDRSIPRSEHMDSRDSRTNNPAEPHLGSTGDIDAIFRDLAYLDTTEWATSREAALKDFGFIDDSTFQAFCHDPDRLAGSQPLVHPPSIADIWPPPGFFPETFQEPMEDTMEG